MFKNEVIKNLKKKDGNNLSDNPICPFFIAKSLLKQPLSSNSVNTYLQSTLIVIINLNNRK